MPGRPSKTTPLGEPISLESKAYRFRVDGTRPTLQIELSSGKAGGKGEVPERLTFELHTPISGEIFEARTSIGRLEVDRDGRVMYFATGGESVGFTLFVGRSVTVTMSRSTGEVTVKSPSKIVSVTRPDERSEDLGNPAPTDMVRIALE